MSAYTTQPFFSGFADLASSLANAPSIYQQSRTGAYKAEREAQQAERQLGQADRRLGQTDQELAQRAKAQTAAEFQSHPNLVYAHRGVQAAMEAMALQERQLRALWAKKLRTNAAGDVDQADKIQHQAEIDAAQTAYEASRQQVEAAIAEYDRVGETLAKTYGSPWVRGQAPTRPARPQGGDGGSDKGTGGLKAPPVAPQEAPMASGGPVERVAGLTDFGISKIRQDAPAPEATTLPPIYGRFNRALGDAPPVAYQPPAPQAPQPLPSIYGRFNRSMAQMFSPDIGFQPRYQAQPDPFAALGSPYVAPQAPYVP